MTTGERMRSRRKELGLSAEYVAEKLGVSPATIYRYENGDIEKMPGNKLEPISQILKTTPEYLMGWEDHKYLVKLKTLECLPDDIFSKICSFLNVDKEALVADSIHHPHTNNFEELDVMQQFGYLVNRMSREELLEALSIITEKLKEK